MSNTRWRARRESYLRESGRTADLIREGFVRSGLALIEGGSHFRQVRKTPPALIIVPRPCATGDLAPISFQRGRTADDNGRSMRRDDHGIEGE